MNDLIIIGGGPAGIAAGVYAARKCLNTVLITETIGGQSTDSLGIENWIGTVNISGFDLAKALRTHIDAYKKDLVNVVEDDRVVKLARDGDTYRATTRDGKEFKARAVLIASGAARRKLDVPGADVLENKGVTYCASCDGPLFAGQDVAVIGGGNAGFETAAQLLAYAKSVTLIHRHKEFKADPVTVEHVLAHPHMRALTHSEPVEVKGEKFVNNLVVRNKDTQELTELPVAGVFVEAGVIPNTDFAEGLVEMDAVKRVTVDPRTQRAFQRDTQHASTDEQEIPGGIWAAGDCTDELYHQNNIAAGDGVKALEDIYIWLKTR